jgi:hypothetical protein
MALPPTMTASTTAMITIGQDKILVMAHFLRCDLKVKFSGVRLRGAGTACDRYCHNQFAPKVSVGR